MVTNVDTELVYFAVCPATCEIFEDTDFRRVYNDLRASFKVRVHGCKYYEYLTAVISCGVVIERGEGYFRRMHCSFRDICRVTVSGIAGKISTDEVIKLEVRA